MNRAVKPDWRIPLIFAVPVVVWAAIAYLAFQPSPQTRTSAAASIPTDAAKPTPYPVIWTDLTPTYKASAPPVYPTAIACSNAAAITAFHATTSVENGNVVIRVRDQNGRLVACAWAAPKGGNHAVGGMTDATGTVTYPLADLPANDYFYGLIQMNGTSATTAYSFSR